MSKYIILKKSFKRTIMSKTRSLSYTVYCHTNTKYKDNEPYWSLDLNMATFYAVDKDRIGSLLKEAQNLILDRKFVPKKSTKDGKIFVLKLNSPKFKAIIEEEQRSNRW